MFRAQAPRIFGAQTWVDHATGEDGYLLQVKPAGAAGFSVAAVLDRDVNAYGLVRLLTEKHASSARSTLANPRTWSR